MKLGDNTLNNEWLSLVAQILLPYNISIILRLKGLLNWRLISRISILLKNLSSGLKIIR